MRSDAVDRTFGDTGSFCLYYKQTKTRGINFVYTSQTINTESQQSILIGVSLDGGIVKHKGLPLKPCKKNGSEFGTKSEHARGLNSLWVRLARKTTCFNPDSASFLTQQGPETLEPDLSHCKPGPGHCNIILVPVIESMSP